MRVFVRSDDSFLGSDGANLCLDGLATFWKMRGVEAFGLTITAKKPDGPALKGELFKQTTNCDCCEPELRFRTKKDPDFTVPSAIDDMLKDLGLHKPGVIYLQLEVLEESR